MTSAPRGVDTEIMTSSAIRRPRCEKRRERRRKIAVIVTVFRSRLKPQAQDEYPDWARRMGAIAAELPGYISHKTFIASDGEHVTLVEFESEETQRRWSEYPAHVKKKGRRDFYAEYRVKVCRVLRDTAFSGSARDRLTPAAGPAADPPRE
jgi:heme-degrading monooxygenase HmoA